jgi:hypothetical protein
MIRGNDIEIPVKPSGEAWVFICRYMKSVWPKCVMIRQHPCPDSFFHENEASSSSWNREGMTEGNDDTMIEVIEGETSFTLVVSDRIGSKTRKMAEELKENFLVNFHIFEITRK